MYRVSPFEGRPYVSRTSSRTGLRRFHAPDAPRRLLGRMGSEDLMFAEIAIECGGTNGFMEVIGVLDASYAPSYRGS
jgi:hypothetical protein